MGVTETAWGGGGGGVNHSRVLYLVGSVGLVSLDKDTL